MKKLLLSALLTLVMTAHAFATCTTGALPFNLQNNTVADATQVMANFNQISTGVSANCAGSGANTDITSLGGLTTPLSTSEGGTWIWTGGTSTGTANAQVLATVTPATGFSLTQNKCVIFTPGFVNTGALTLNVFSTGAINVFRQTPLGAQAMTGGEVVVGQQTLVCYDGTQYELMSPSEQFGGVGAVKTIASAATVDLGTAGAHYVNVTGTTTITSFGSSASTTYPLYYVTFAGALTLTNNNTSLILPGGANITTAANDTAWVLYLGSGNWQVTSYNKASGQPISAPALRSYLAGNTLSGGGSTTLTITAGSATSDDQSTLMNLPSTFTKTFASWAVGTGNGGLDTGSIATATWYHVFIIERTDTGVVDVLISLSATAPTLPTNYTKQRRIGSIRTDATPNIISFFQNGDTFLWSTLPALDVNTTMATTAATVTTFVPTGVRVEGIYHTFVSTASGGSGAWLLSSLDIADTAPGFNATPLATNTSNGNSSAVTTGGQARIWTNTSAQIRTRGATSGPNVQLQSIGWVDPRGKLN